MAISPSSYAVLEHYGRRYINRFGKMPKKKDLDPVLARTLINYLGSVESAIGVLDLWFDSPDPWYASHGFALDRCFSAINRLFATGDIEAGGTADEREMIRSLCASLFLKPQLRIIRREPHRIRGRKSES